MTARALRLLGRMLAFGGLLAATAAFSADDNQIIYPGKSPSANLATPASAGGVGLLPVVGVIALAAAGGWLLWSKRGVALAGRDARQLTIAETRPLGNRQYLVVAAYEGKKFLLGVCPGRIEMLTPLDGTPPQEKKT